MLAWVSSALEAIVSHSKDNVMTKQLSRHDYTVGWICPLEIEQIAATAMLEEKHRSLPKSGRDNNNYTLGRIGHHNIVIAGLSEATNVSAATATASLKMTFPRVSFALLVGLGGAVPTNTAEGPIQLGHVVIGTPSGTYPGIIQIDHGKAQHGYFERTGVIQKPPNILLNAARTLGVRLKMTSPDPLLAQLTRLKSLPYDTHQFEWPGLAADVLHDYSGQQVERPERRDIDTTGQLMRILVHRGTIASGGAIIRSALRRDQIVSESGADILCFETEAAGAHNDLPCLTIRGISNYCDRHKNDQWDGFAASAAASYACELVRTLPSDDLDLTIVSPKGWSSS